MASRPVSKEKVQIDPIFPIPSGAEDEFAVSRSKKIIDDTVDLVIFDDGTGTGGDGSPDTPSIVGVVSQKLRRGQNMQFVVDVVIQVDDVNEAEHYEIQVTKI